MGKEPEGRAMGVLSSVGTVAGIAAFAAGAMLGMSLGFPEPLSWVIAFGMAVGLSAVTAGTFEVADLRKRHPVNTFGERIIREVAEGVEVNDCYSCSGADIDGFEVGYAKDHVVAGMVTERVGGGYGYYCSACHEDDIQAALRAGYEREFRQWWERADHDDHYMEVLAGMREAYLAAEVEHDFWEWTDAIRQVVDRDDQMEDPRVVAEYIAAKHTEDDSVEFWERLAERTGEDKYALAERFGDRWWTQYVHLGSGRVEPEPDREEAEERKERQRERESEAETSLEGLPDEYY